MTIVQASTYKSKLAFLAAGLVAALLLLLPSTASATSNYAKFKSINQTSFMSCEEAKYSVYNAFGYTVNSAGCGRINNSYVKLITANYQYDVSKKYEKCNFFLQNCGSWQTTIVKGTLPR